MADACAGCLVSKTRLCLKNLFLNIITLKIERKKKKRKKKRKKRCSWSLQSYDIWPFSWDSLCPYHLSSAKLKRGKYFYWWRILFIYTLLLRPSLKIYNINMRNASHFLSHTWMHKRFRWNRLCFSLSLS